MVVDNGAMAEDGSLSQEEIDALLSMGDDSPPPNPAGSGGASAGGGDDLNLDSLLGGDSPAPSTGPALDNDALMAIAGAVGGAPPDPHPSRLPSP